MRFATVAGRSRPLRDPGTVRGAARSRAWHRLPPRQPQPDRAARARNSREAHSTDNGGGTRCTFDPNFGPRGRAVVLQEDPGRSDSRVRGILDHCDIRSDRGQMEATRRAQPGAFEQHPAPASSRRIASGRGKGTGARPTRCIDDQRNRADGRAIRVEEHARGRPHGLRPHASNERPRASVLPHDPPVSA
jgi:hypothetical protein